MNQVLLGHDIELPQLRRETSFDTSQLATPKTPVARRELPVSPKRKTKMATKVVAWDTNTLTLELPTEDDDCACSVHSAHDARAAKISKYMIGDPHRDTIALDHKLHHASLTDLYTRGVVQKGDDVTTRRRHIITFGTLKRDNQFGGSRGSGISLGNPPPSLATSRDAQGKMSASVDAPATSAKSNPSRGVLVIDGTRFDVAA